MNKIDNKLAVLFDFDGTLVESENIWLEAKVKALQEMGVSCHEDEIREFAGQNLNAVFRHFSAELSDVTDESKMKFYILVDKISLALIPEYLKEISGAREILLQFKEDGFVMAICSNAPTYFIETTLQFLELDGYFEHMFSAANTDKGKPNPFVYLEAVESLGLNKERTVAIEDSRSGVDAALAAGISVVWINGQRNSENQDNLYHVESLADLNPDLARNFLSF